MLRSHQALTLGAAVLWLYGCAATTFISTWKAPDAREISPAGKTIAPYLYRTMIATGVPPKTPMHA